MSELHPFDPMELKCGDTLRVPVAGRGNLDYRIVKRESDRRCNTFLRCFQVPQQKDWILANPRYAWLSSDCSELVCVYIDWPTHGICTTEESLQPATVRVAGVAVRTGKELGDYIDFREYVNGGEALDGFGEMRFEETYPECQKKWFSMQAGENQ
jgi:hypothetical protein